MRGMPGGRHVAFRIFLGKRRGTVLVDFLGPRKERNVDALVYHLFLAFSGAFRPSRRLRCPTYHRQYEGTTRLCCCRDRGARRSSAAWAWMVWFHPDPGRTGRPRAATPATGHLTRRRCAPSKLRRNSSKRTSSWSRPRRGQPAKPGPQTLPLVVYAIKRRTPQPRSALVRAVSRLVSARSLLRAPHHLAADDGRHRPAPERLPVERRIAALGERLVHVVGPLSRAENRDVGRRAGASVPRSSPRILAGPVVNSSTSRASVILPGCTSSSSASAERRLQPDDAERAALELLHLFAARMRRMIGGDGVDRAGHDALHHRAARRTPSAAAASSCNCCRRAACPRRSARSGAAWPRRSPASPCALANATIATALRVEMCAT